MACSTEGSILAGIAAPTTGDDAQLVVFCNQFMVLDAELHVLLHRHDVPDSEMDAVTGAQSAIIKKMDALTATTTAGHRARAMVFDKMWTRNEEGYFDLVLHWDDIGPLIRDLIGGPV